MSALRDSVIIKLSFVKLSRVEKYCSLATIEFVSIYEGNILYGYKVKAPTLHKTLKYLFVIFVCCVELRAKVNSRGQN